MSQLMVVYVQNDDGQNAHSIVVNSPSLESCYNTLKNIKKDGLKIINYRIYEYSNVIYSEDEEEK